MGRLIAPLAFAAVFFLLPAAGNASECGKVSIAEMNWASAGVAAQVDRFILETGYGCTVSLVPGDTESIFDTMVISATPDIAPEIWVNALRASLNEALEKKRVVQAAQILTDGGIEGWWIPRYIAEENPGIRTVQDALKRPDLFPALNGSGKAVVHNCPDGWNCQISTANLFRALDGEKAGFELAPAASAEALDETIRKAYEAKTGWLGYYWAPTALLANHQMLRLSFGVDHDKTEWNSCTAVRDCAAPKVNSYPASDVFTVVTQKFAERDGAALAYVRKRQWGNATLAAILAWMEENKAGNEGGARHFLEEYQDVWTPWVEPETAAKIKAAL